jgi:hypothetical protein
LGFIGKPEQRHARFGAAQVGRNVGEGWVAHSLCQLHVCDLFHELLIGKTLGAESASCNSAMVNIWVGGVSFWANAELSIPNNRIKALSFHTLPPRTR